MNGRELLVGLGYISEELYEEARVTTVTPYARRNPLSRPVLIAALIALTALLVGCSVLYVLRLQDLSIGKESYTQHYDESGKVIDPQEKTKDVLSLSGFGDETLQNALAEWYEFLKTYDPEGELATNEADIPEVPNPYEYIYECYTPEMAAKLEEIADKYNLKLLEEVLVFQYYQSHIFLEETGIGSLLREESSVTAGEMTGMLYLPGNFRMEMELTLDDSQRLYAYYGYTNTEYMPQGMPGGGLDLSNYKQWDYASSDGTTLLLALSNKGHGLILAQQEKANIVISVNGDFSGSLYPEEEDILSQKEMETIADAFDYSVCPKSVDFAAISAKMNEAEATYRAEHAYVPESYGSFVQYLKERIQVPNETLQYAFYDLTGDGEEELLIGHDGAYTEWHTLRNGEVLTQLVLETYLCEGGVEERYTAYEIYESHMYLAPLSENAVDDLDEERQVLTFLRREKNQWTQSSRELSPDRREITEKEAQSVMACYPRRNLNWKPLMDYPLDENGTTLRDFLAQKDVRLPETELTQRYRDWMAASKESWHTDFRLLDINADGVKDLLLSGNGEYFWQAVTFRHGSIVSLVEDSFYLCENGVLELISTRWDGGIEMDGHQYMRITESGRDILELVVYNKASASWQSDWYESEMTQSQAQTIMDRYSRLDQGMMPIEEFLND